MKSPAGGNSDAQMLAFSTSGHHLLVVVIPEKAGIIDNRGGAGKLYCDSLAEEELLLAC